MNRMKELKPNANSPYDQGYYKPNNPQKYKGLDKRIIFRSGLEFKFCKYCDEKDFIVEWVSEPFSIPYKHPFEKDEDGKPKTHNYWFDFLIRKKEGNEIVTYIVEVKPKSLLVKPKPVPPTANVKTRRNYNEKLKTIIINRTKAAAAASYAKARNFKYMFVTEDFFKN